MAMQILVNECTACGGCEFECPNGAITMKGDVYLISAKKCTECEDIAPAPKCADQCPADAIVAAAA